MFAFFTAVSMACLKISLRSGSFALSLGEVSCNAVSKSTISDVKHELPFGYRNNFSLFRFFLFFLFLLFVFIIFLFLSVRFLIFFLSFFYFLTFFVFRLISIRRFLFVLNFDLILFFSFLSLNQKYFISPLFLNLPTNLFTILIRTFLLSQSIQKFNKLSKQLNRSRRILLLMFLFNSQLNFSSNYNFPINCKLRATFYAKKES